MDSGEIKEKALSVKDLTYKPKQNNSYVIANAIIETICYKNKIDEKLEVSSFSDLEFYDWNEDNEQVLEIFRNSKNILKEATRVIRVLEILEHKRPTYKLSTDEWFELSHFLINDNLVLKELSPILLYYVGNESGASPSIFFQKLDFLIEYIIKPCSKHSNTFEIENHIINSINNSEEIEILDENGNIISVCALQIKFITVSANKIEKILVYQVGLNEPLEEVLLDKVMFKRKEKIEKGISNNPLTMMKTLTTNLEVNTMEDNKEDCIEVILECNTVVYDYFKMKPLKKMQIFDTKEKLHDFHRTFEFKPKDNKFYIVANDNEGMVISTVLHALPHARVIKPMELNFKLKDMFKDYFKELPMDLCPPTSPNNPEESTSDSKNKTGEKDVTKKTKKPLTKEEKERSEKLRKHRQNTFKDRDIP